MVKKKAQPKKPSNKKKKAEKITVTVSAPKMSPVQLFKELQEARELEKTKKKGRKKGEEDVFFNGRDQSMVITLLCEAWACDATDTQACVHAGIARSSLNRFIEKHPELRDMKLYYKQKFIMDVKIAHYKDLSNPYTRGATAKWILERREPKRYNLTQKVQMGEDKKNPFGGTLLDAMLGLKQIDAKKKIIDATPQINQPHKP